MTRPLYLPLHRITLADEVEEAESEMMRNTHTRQARIDEPETIITDFGGLAEPRPNIVKRAFDSFSHGTDAELLGQLDKRTRTLDEIGDPVTRWILVVAAVISVALFGYAWIVSYLPATVTRLS